MGLFVKLFLAVIAYTARLGSKFLAKLLEEFKSALVKRGRMTTGAANEWISRMRSHISKKNFSEVKEQLTELSKGMSKGERVRLVYDVATSVLSIAAFYDLYKRVEGLEASGDGNEEAILNIPLNENAVGKAPEIVYAELENSMEGDGVELEVQVIDNGKHDIHAIFSSVGSSGTSLGSTTSTLGSSSCNSLVTAKLLIDNKRDEIRELANILRTTDEGVFRFIELLSKIKFSDKELL